MKKIHSLRNNSLEIRALPFQKGDHIMTPRGAQTITAVGWWKLGPVYRTGRSTYWSDWQIRMVKP